ncbi:4Fe-4S dicluster domain-containing protein [Neomoorella humiferrea]|uniref:4Fe-4S dicluster domain-containing protein n=1 Tax=Neomoorella humiferrea TaxID=676965 RepID=UPI003D948DE9
MEALALAAGIIAKVEEAGVVGAGGAGFPTHHKLNTKVDTIIVNGAECEPLLYVDQELMATKAQVLVATLEQLLTATGASEGFIALKGKYQRALKALQAAIRGTKIKIYQLPNYYPIGDEHVLTYEVTKRIIPPGGIPPRVGVLVLNVETVVNIAGALDGKPVVEKYVTINGNVDTPGTYVVPVGTPIRELLAIAGQKGNDNLVLVGGPMMGKIVSETDVVTKTTKGIIVLPVRHPLSRKKVTETTSRFQRLLNGCCQCRQCTDFCPRYLLGHNLEPHRSMRCLALKVMQIDWLEVARLCSECGLCDLFVCPSGLSPRTVHKAIKVHLAAAGYRSQFQDMEPQPRATRAWRQIPTDRLIARLNLAEYNRPLPFYKEKMQPSKVILPLKQNAGVASIPVVAVGEEVEYGQLVARVPEGQLGANLHASIKGRITNTSEAIVIESSS